MLLSHDGLEKKKIRNDSFIFFQWLMLKINLEGLEIQLFF